ncbi:hypothetical protein KAW65_02305 [candidate division WOR-3 bacterium]|nr:hypothetical protein [candidate division WOR-3 bacterium]
MREYKNLQRLLIIIFLLLSIVPLSLVTYLSYERSRNSLYKSITKNLTQIAKDKASSINNWIFERVTDAKVISKSPWIREALEHPRLPKSANGGQAQIPHSLHAELTHHLKLVKENYGYYDELFILDIYGNFVIGTGGEEENKSDRDYFINARNGMPVVTDIRESESTGKPTMLISHSIRDKYNKVVGVLVERIKLDLISKIMREIKVGKTGESYLLNKEGYFLTESKFEPDCVLKKKVSTEGYENCIQYHQGVGEYIDYRGRPVLGSYLWMPERKWCLMVEQDVHEAFSQISTLRNTTIGICLATIVLVIGASLILSGRIINILKKKDDELAIKTKELLRTEKLSAAGKLAAGIAHEIGNPLAGIINCVKLISRELGKESKKVSKYLTSIEREAMRCAKTIRDFLNFTRESELKIGEVHINQVIEDTLLLITPQCASQKVIIDKELDTIPTIAADGVQLGQAFTNIILNSLSAMPGGGKLRIQTLEKDKHIEIVFSDTGTGIKEEDMGKIFEPFFTTKREGTGLGLLVVYDIIDKHDGSIRVESEVGKGTKFTIRLPICQRF